MTAAGVLLVLGTLAWYAGSVLLRAAAFGWFVFAGVGLLLAGHGDQSPWAPVTFAGLGGACWARRTRATPDAPQTVGHPRLPHGSSPDASRRAPERQRTAGPAALTARPTQHVCQRHWRALMIGSGPWPSWLCRGSGSNGAEMVVKR